ncbi:hypothetical protein [uncultured Gammaproteobacteria bacterium]|nr:hypothetical protein [uncultured Gammaproteobacteria bacterium]
MGCFTIRIVDIYHHIGGLEKLDLKFYSSATIYHHIGGLEN